jgi:proteasome alpha subunit
VALLIGGVEDGEPRLYETDPSGTPYEWKAVSVGADRGDLTDYLEEHYEEDADLDGGVELALRALASVNDDELSPEGVGVATIDAESASFIELQNDEIEEYLAEHELLPEEEGADADDADDADTDDNDEA